jgi:hypothetical protein
MAFYCPLSVRFRNGEDRASTWRGAKWEMVTKSFHRSKILGRVDAAVSGATGLTFGTGRAKISFPDSSMLPSWSKAPNVGNERTELLAVLLPVEEVCCVQCFQAVTDKATYLLNREMASKKNPLECSSGFKSVPAQAVLYGAGTGGLSKEPIRAVLHGAGMGGLVASSFELLHILRTISTAVPPSQEQFQVTC